MRVRVGLEARPEETGVRGDRTSGPAAAGAGRRAASSVRSAEVMRAGHVRAAAQFPATTGPQNGGGVCGG